MKIKKILILLLTLMLTTTLVYADNSKQSDAQVESLEPLSSSISESIMNNFYSSPVFKPYTLSTHEVQFSYTKNLINAIDPTPSSNRMASHLPGTRGTNQLVIYTPFYGARTNTNEYGAEAIVVGNTVTELSGADSPIPPDGIVISGHGRAKNWINNSIKVGTKIYVDLDKNWFTHIQPLKVTSLNRRKNYRS